MNDFLAYPNLIRFMGNSYERRERLETARERGRQLAEEVIRKIKKEVPMTRKLVHPIESSIAPDARTVRPGHSITYDPPNITATSGLTAVGLRATIEKMAEKSDKLSALDDRIGALIARVEKMMVTAKVSVYISVPIPGEMADFAWTKLDGAWRFVVSHGPDRDHVGPYLSASRKLRARAPELIIALLKSAPTQMDEMIQQRTAAIADGDVLIARLEELYPDGVE